MVGDPRSILQDLYTLLVQCGVVYIKLCDNPVDLVRHLAFVAQLDEF